MKLITIILFLAAALAAQTTNHGPQIFQPSTTLAGARLTCAALPSAPVNGDIACDSGDSNKVKVRSNGAWVVVPSLVTSKVWLPAVGCNGTAGSLLWDTLATLAPTATCSAGSTETTLMRGVADFPDSDGDYSIQLPLILPSDWTGNIDLLFKWRAAATTGDAVWQAATVCRADGEVDDAAFNAANTVTDTTKGTANQLNDATMTSITTTGCAAGEILHLKVFRNRTHASDTITGVVSLSGVEVTLRRTGLS